MRRPVKTGTQISIILSVGAVSLCLALTGCGSQPRQSETPPAPASQPPTAQPPTAQPQRFDLRGKVVAVDKAGKKVTVDHENIPGFMGAMTMAYPVKDGGLLEHISPGDQVTAKVVSSGGDYWLEDIAAVAKPIPSK
jgi:Cu/Ag efflux protein CusF